MAGMVQKDPTSGALTLNLFATGAKTYGANGSHTATAGPVAKAGYAERERKKRARNAAVQRRLGQQRPYDPRQGGA